MCLWMLGSEHPSSPPAYVFQSDLGLSKVGEGRLWIVADGIDAVPAEAESQIVVRPERALHDWDGLLR